MKKRALIFSGGWDGHQPQVVADRLRSELARHGVETDLQANLDCLNDLRALEGYQVIIPNWTMGTLPAEASKNLSAAVRNGVGLAGAHGGMGDAFRGNIEYEWMVGGHFVGHPHVGDYTVRLTGKLSPITDGLPLEFPYNSEQYYLQIDPGIEVLADSIYLYEGSRAVMPIAWTKHWGKGRVFYSSLGHDPKEFDEFPHGLQMTVRGFLWAARLL